LSMDWIREEKTNMAITGIWPAVAIESAATQDAVAADMDRRGDLRKPAIFSDAILAMLNSATAEVNGVLTTDEDFLRDMGGVTDFSKYNLVPGSVPRRIMPKEFPDLTVEGQNDEGVRTDSTVLHAKRHAKL
jgi:hypothetical protein